MTKKELRNKYKNLRTQLSENTLEDWSLAVANNTLKAPIWEMENYHIFLPISRLKELNTEFILHILQGKDKNIVLSKTDFEENTMRHYLMTDATKIEVNKWGIPEPINGFTIDSKQIDVVFVPLLCFDKKGNRVGYGKGFYDRFLANCRKDTIKIGLSFFEAEEYISDASPLDIKLNMAITPNNIYHF